jgi:hypothetical protein
MPIAGGLDIHRKQITFGYLDTGTGEVRRGRVRPADRLHLRAWLAGFAGRDDVAFAWRGAPDGGTWPGSWPRPGSRRIWPGRPAPRHGAAGTARQDR